MIGKLSQSIGVYFNNQISSWTKLSVKPKLSLSKFDGTRDEVTRNFMHIVEEGSLGFW